MVLVGRPDADSDSDGGLEYKALGVQFTPVVAPAGLVTCESVLNLMLTAFEPGSDDGGDVTIDTAWLPSESAENAAVDAHGHVDGGSVGCKAASELPVMTT